MNDDLVRYIEQNRNTYTREAIDQQLVLAGHSPEQIEGAWTAVGARHAEQAGGLVAGPPGGQDAAAARGPQKVISSPLFWAIVVGFVVLACGLPSLLGYLSATYVTSDSALPIAAIVIYGVLQLGGIIGGVISVNRNQPRAYGLLIGVAVATALPACLGVIFLGICINAFTEYYNR